MKNLRVVYDTQAGGKRYQKFFAKDYACEDDQFAAINAFIDKQLKKYLKYDRFQSLAFHVCEMDGFWADYMWMLNADDLDKFNSDEVIFSVCFDYGIRDIVIYKKIDDRIDLDAESFKAALYTKWPAITSFEDACEMIEFYKGWCGGMDIEQINYFEAKGWNVLKYIDEKNYTVYGR